jgi:Fe-S-cluster containining protein
LTKNYFFWKQTGNLSHFKFFDMLEPDSLLPYLCQITGKCCINNLVPLSPFDVFRVAKFLNLKAEDLFTEKIIAYKITGSTYFMEPVLQMRPTLACPFLTKSKESEYQCSIYEARPYTCRIFPLKYDPDNDGYLRSTRGEERCLECTTSKKEIAVKDYLNCNDIGDMAFEYAKYRNLVEKLSLMGYNVKELAGQKLKQKLFFNIQKLLYETFPTVEQEEDYPWNLVYQTILGWTNEFQAENQTQ